MSTFYVPAVNLIGRGVINEFGTHVKELGFKKALIVTDHYIAGSEILPKVTQPLEADGIAYVVFEDVDPNPSCQNVYDGLKTLEENSCDFIISVGGGSPQDAASCISIMATNGGKPQDYEGLHKSEKKGLPVVAINTTAGTSAEITINYVITDEERKVKMVMVDKNSLALISVNDPELMLPKPADLTATTGMDALTHAVEALVTPGAYDATKKLSIGAIELIKEYLPRAVANGHDIEAMEIRRCPHETELVLSSHDVLCFVGAELCLSDVARLAERPCFRLDSLVFYSPPTFPISGRILSKLYTVFGPKGGV